MIKVRLHDNLYDAELYCDVCGYRIEDYRVGVAVYEAVSKEEAHTAVLHVHKGYCHGQAAGAMGGRMYARWDELSDHLVYLARSLDMGLAYFVETPAQQSETDRL